jgi:hypothetical protein
MSTIQLTPPACELEKRFNADVCKLRELWGTTTFWADMRKVRNAKRGIAVQYLNGKFAAPDRVANTFMATMQELVRRAMMVGKSDELLPED